MGSVFGADGAGEFSLAENLDARAVFTNISHDAGTVVASSDARDPLLHKRVFLVPMRGWESDPDAPESK